ncbi:mitogen-activated protein kinase [Ancistrocladus abbreviatus]
MRRAAAARPGKVVGPLLRHKNCGVAATAEALEQRRMARNAAIPSQFAASSCSYPKRNPGCRNGRADDEGIEGPNWLQQKPQYLARKVAAAESGTGSRRY